MVLLRDNSSDVTFFSPVLSIPHFTRSGRMVKKICGTRQSGIRSVTADDTISTIELTVNALDRQSRVDRARTDFINKFSERCVFFFAALQLLSCYTAVVSGSPARHKQRTSRRRKEKGKKRSENVV